MKLLRATARDMWTLLEPVHAVVYFAPEPLAALKEAGYRGFWMGYFAGRAAPLGPASSELVHALFYNFDFGRVSRALPAAWSYGGPEIALRARLDGSVAALRRQVGTLVDDDTVARAADLAERAAASAPIEGRPLYAANRVVPKPGEPLARLWHAATLLREHRGDGHVATLMNAGISGRASHVLHAVASGTSKVVYEASRDFSDSELLQHVNVLRERGCLDAGGQLTPVGVEMKNAIENRTDVLAETAYSTLDDSEIDELRRALRPIAHAVVSAGDIPTKPGCTEPN